MPTRKDVIRRLKFSRIHRPHTITQATVMPLSGALAIIYGDAVSRALSIVGGGVFSRLIGAAMLAGSALVVAGIARNRSLMEASGLLIQAAGCALYGVGVIAGLGLGGMIAGPIVIGVAIGNVLRVVSLTMAAHEVPRPNGVNAAGGTDE